MSTKNVSILIIFLFFSLIFYVWQRTQNIRLGYELNELQTKCGKINQENMDIQLRISSYLSMEKLDEIAKKNNLFVPDEKSVIFLEEKEH